MADVPSTLDGVVSSAPVPPPVPGMPNAANEQGAVKRWKALLAIAAAFLYLIYALWCGFLLSVLPSQENTGALSMIGLFTCLLGGLAFAGIATAAFARIAQSKAGSRARLMAMIKLGILTIPGILLSAATAFMITREPSYTIDIVSPSTAQELVAPLAMTFSVENAANVLKNGGFTALRYGWDVNGDREIDQETLEPTLTAEFAREGVYGVSVVMTSADGERKTASRRFVIRQAVFSVTPSPPIIDKPVVFDLSHLFPDKNVVSSVSWDFDGDGTYEEENGGIQATNVFLRTGKFTVNAVVKLSNNTQASYERTIDVVEPPALPFPVTVETQPRTLIGTAPFGVLFDVVTDEPIAGVQWNFGDGQRSEGARATHTYTQNGNYAVTAKVRSQSGVVADVSTLVKVVNALNLNDLRYEGSPDVQGNRIRGEVPLTIDLEAVTQKPFVQFSWEAPDATEVGSVQGRLQAIYRRSGTYVITLVAQDAENQVMRRPIQVEVLPASSLISIRMDPETGVAPLTVKFDASESTIPGEDITGFIWNFGDNSPQEFGGAAAQHTYRNAGTYVINLTARTSSGRQQSASKTLVVRAPILQSRPLASRLSGSAPLTVAFDGTSSTGPIASWLWNFGDGTQNDLSKTEHTFLEPGRYDVQLTVTDVTGKTALSTVTILVD